MAFNPRLEQAKYIQGFLHAEDMPSVAADALEAGFDGRALRSLAGLVRPTSWEADPLWRTAQSEMNLIAMSKEDALLLVADWLIEEFESGKRSLRSTSKWLERLCWTNDYDERLINIFQLEDVRGVEGYNDPEIDSLLIECFKRFKKRDFIPPVDTLPYHGPL